MTDTRNPFGWLGVFMIMNDWIVMIGTSFLGLGLVVLLAVALLGAPSS
jgi:hypothetical protein